MRYFDGLFVLLTILVTSDLLLWMSWPDMLVYSGISFFSFKFAVEFFEDKGEMEERVGRENNIDTCGLPQCGKMT